MRKMRSVSAIGIENKILNSIYIFSGVGHRYGKEILWDGKTDL